MDKLARIEVLSVTYSGNIESCYFSNRSQFIFWHTGRGSIRLKVLYTPHIWTETQQPQHHLHTNSFRKHCSLSLSPSLSRASWSLALAPKTSAHFLSSTRMHWSALPSHLLSYSLSLSLSISHHTCWWMCVHSRLPVVLFEHTNKS